jgi:hypothetical protein
VLLGRLNHYARGPFACCCLYYLFLSSFSGRFYLDLTAKGLIFQESDVHSLSNKMKHPNISREQQTRTSNSNAAHHATNSITDQTTALPDATIRIIKNQLTTAKMYLGLFASRGNHGFTRELRARMRDIQRALGDARSDRQLPHKYILFYCSNFYSACLVIVYDWCRCTFCLDQASLT